MKIKYICPYWGQEGVSASEFLQNVADAGYDGVEVNAPEDAKFEKELLEGIAKHGLTLIAQQWLMWQNESVQSYISRMEARLLKLVEFKPKFINAHTGRDFFSFEDNCAIIDKCNEITAKTGVEIYHETHRGRFPFSAAATQGFLKAYPNLTLTADYSHWVTVSESFLEDQQEALHNSMKHVRYVHARVGHTQSPQVNHPFTPENEEYLNTFVGWWKSILEIVKQRGDKEFYICPEFGPFPYMQAVPFTNLPMASQWDINVAMMNYLRKKW